MKQKNPTNRRKLHVEELNRVSIETFRGEKKIPLVMVLDNVRSQHNIGSVFRTADAFRVEEIILCGITATPPQAEIHKTALGAEYSMKWRYFDDTLSAIEALRDEGYKIYAIEQTEGSIPLQEITCDKEMKYAIVFGHEVHGVQQSVVDASDGVIEIPQYGTKHSLNVSVTAGIVVWDFFNKLFSSFE